MQKHRIELTGLLSLLLMVSGLSAARADDDFNAGPVTWSRDVAPIVMKHCAECHRPGESAPMSLLKYEDARPWAKAIRTAVASREMPPWDADPEVGHWANDISLSDTQIATIVRWVDQGAREGDAADLPATPEFVSGWKFGEPDYVVELDEVHVPADGPNLFPTLEAVIRLPEDRWIRAAEVRPGNGDVLHHLVAFVANGPLGGAGVGNTIAGWAVGMPPVQYPEGMGRKVSRLTKLLVNMHYQPSGVAATDRTRIGLYFGEGELKKEMASSFAGDLTFRIPPNDPAYPITGTHTFREDVYLTTLTPHMHLRGQNIEYTAIYPDGTEELLLRVPKYDFNWQWRYILAEPKLMPEGTRLDVRAIYNNSAENPFNPDPNAWVTFGEETGDEMLVAAFEYYVAEGVSPKRFSMDERIDMVLADRNSPDAYRVKLDLGVLTLPTILELPRDGREGTWVFALGEQTIPITLEPLEWDGTRFTARMDLFGGGILGVIGELREDGTVEGTFDATALETEAGPTSMFKPRGFSGVKAAAGT